MKKSFPVNINGRIYNIDEDAYALLKNYLDQLHATFTGAEGQEIVADIEGRVAELFDERLSAGIQVIDIADVNRVIAIMGRPEDLGGSMPDEQSGTTVGAGYAATPPPYEQQEPEPRHKLYRNIDNKMMGGVLSGLAAYFGTDPNLLRVLMIILTVCTAFWPCFIGYLIAWAVIPPADTPRRRLELRGEAVSVEAVGRGVLASDTASQQPRGGGSGFAGFLNVLAKCVMGFVGLVAGMLGLAMTLSILCLVGVMIALPFSAAISAQMIHIFPGGGVMLALICATLSCLMILLPCIALLWLALYVVFGVRGCSTGVIVGALVIEILIFVAVIVLSLIIGSGSFGYWWWQHI